MLVAGTGRQPLAADAFVTLGKVHSIAGTVDAEELGPFSAALPVPKSLLFHQVAMVLDADHSVAANELAVQLGRLGDWSEARDLLQVSLRQRPTPEAWRNLAEAHERLGEPGYAELARREASLIRNPINGSQSMAAIGERRPSGADPRFETSPGTAPRNARGGSGVPFFSGVR